MIANGWSPPDVGAAIPLASRLDAVVLYASRDGLGSSTESTLRQLRPARVVLVGGTAALSENVAAEVRSVASGAEIRRFHGPDRVGTAAEAVRAPPVMPTGQPVVIANGWSPPDVGVAAALAHSLGGSVLFASGDSLGQATDDALRWLEPSQAILVGSTVVLSADVETALIAAVPGASVLRLGGLDRTDTAGQGAQLARVSAGGPVVIANGWSPPDIGVAAALAAATNGTVLYSSRTALGRFTVQRLGDLSPSDVLLVGGSESLAATVPAQVSGLLPSGTIQRVSGHDRQETAAAAALHAISKARPRTGGGNGDNQLVYVAMGDSFASGVGTNSPPASRDTNPCYRTRHAYGSQLFYEMLDWVPPVPLRPLEPTYRFTACGGARTRHVTSNGQAKEQWPDENWNQDIYVHWDPQYPQIDYLDESVDLITITAGGNDLGFTSIVTFCVVVADCHDKFHKTTADGVDPNRSNVRALYNRSFETYRRILDHAPNATVYVVGYPMVFSNWETFRRDTCILYRFLETKEVAYLQELNAALNQTIQAAAEDAGVFFVDIANSPAGAASRGVCSNPGGTFGYINDPGLSEGEFAKVRQENFLHPNKDAHQAYAEEILSLWFPGWKTTESLNSYLIYNRVSFRSALVANPSPLFRRGTEPPPLPTYRIGFIEDRFLVGDHPTDPMGSEWVAGINLAGATVCDNVLTCRVGVRSQPTSPDGQWSEYVY